MTENLAKKSEFFVERVSQADMPGLHNVPVRIIYADEYNSRFLSHTGHYNGIYKGQLYTSLQPQSSAAKRGTIGLWLDTLLGRRNAVPQERILELRVLSTERKYIVR